MRILKNTAFLLFLLMGNTAGAFAQSRPALQLIYFNLYTDSLKPVLNYYVNVEGKTFSGNYLPLDTNDVKIRSDWGEMRGNEWVIPSVLLYDSVTFTAVSRRNPELKDRITIWIQKRKDPRDAPDYEEGQSVPEKGNQFPPRGDRRGQR